MFLLAEPTRVRQPQTWPLSPVILQPLRVPSVRTDVCRQLVPQPEDSKLSSLTRNSLSGKCMSPLLLPQRASPGLSVDTQFNVSTIQPRDLNMLPTRPEGHEIATSCDIIQFTAGILSDKDPESPLTIVGQLPSRRWTRSIGMCNPLKETVDSRRLS